MTDAVNGPAPDAKPEAALEAFVYEVGAATPHEAIRLACARLRHEVIQAGWSPDLGAYVRAFGCRVLEAPIPTAGRLDLDGDTYVIRVRRSDGSSRRSGIEGELPPSELDPAAATNRQRFSIAHELGHALLLHSLRFRPDDRRRLRDPEIWSRVEQLCDVAAAELLLPLDQFMAHVSRYGFSPRAIQHIVKEHRVSSEVAVRRFLAAGARAVILCRVRPNPRRVQLSLATIVGSYAAERGPRLDLGTPASVIRPNLVLRAFRSGRSRTRSLTVTRGAASWVSAGIAEANQDEGGLGGVGQAKESSAAPKSIYGSAAGQLERANVTVILLPATAPDAAHALWLAGATTSY